MPKRVREKADRQLKVTATAKACVKSLKHFLKADSQSEAIVLAHLRLTGTPVPGPEFLVEGKRKQ